MSANVSSSLHGKPASLDPLVWVNPGIRVLTFLREDCSYSPRKSYKKLFEDLGETSCSY